MKIYIDQSGKIEDTAKDTVLALSNHHQYAVLIHKKTKRQIQEQFRQLGLTKLYIYHLFSVGIFYLLKSLPQPTEVTIDLEYFGKDKIILSLIEKLFTEYQIPGHHITFARIGNKPKVHYAAKDVFDKKIPPNQVLNYEKIIRVLKKTDGRLRECLSTLVSVQPRSYKKNIPHFRKKFKISNLKKTKN